MALEFGDEVEGDDQQLDGRQDERELHGDRIGQGALQGRQHGAADQCHHDNRAGGFGVAAVLDGGQGAGVDGRPSRSQEQAYGHGGPHGAHARQERDA